MMIYFQIAGCGFSIDSRGQAEKVDKYFRVFQVSEDAFKHLNEKIVIHVEEERFEIPNKVQNVGYSWIFKGDNQIGCVVPYGHYKNAVMFYPHDWKQNHITVKVNPDIYQEVGYSISTLVSIIGCHSAFLYRNAMLIHASYITTEKGAILFTAPSQTGKSTQASLWNRVMGAEIINGDRVILRKKENQWFAYGVPMCGSSDICKNKEMPIRAIVVLEQGSKNVVFTMKMMERYKALLLASAHYVWSEEEMTMANFISLQVMKEVQIMKLKCLPDEDAVWTLKKYLDEVEKDGY